MPSVSPETLTALLETVLCLVSRDFGGADARLRESKPPPALFLRFAEHHYLGGYLVSVLQDSGLRDVFPDEEMEMVLSAAQRRRKGQSGISAEMSRLLPRVEANGIDVILLKGQYLAERFLLNRTYVDLDLLVRPSQIRGLETLLTGMGYRRISKFLISRRISMRLAHGCDFVRDRIRLDAHWCLGSHISYRVDYRRVWEDSRLFQLSSGNQVRVLSDEDTLFFLLLSVSEDIDRGGLRLRSFVDLHAMLEQLDPEIDWPAFWAQRRVERTRGPCEAVLALFFMLLSTEKNFPRAAASIQSALELTREQPWPETAALVQASPGSLRNKLWSLRHYECGFVTALLWWCISLPFRLMIYQRRS